MQSSYGVKSDSVLHRSSLMADVCSWSPAQLRYNQGFFDQSAKMWTPGGVLVATSHQVVYFKE